MGFRQKLKEVKENMVRKIQVNNDDEDQDPGLDFDNNQKYKEVYVTTEQATILRFERILNELNEIRKLLDSINNKNQEINQGSTNH